MNFPMTLQVERMHDEAVQLKVLQTALTLMQSTMLAQNEASIHGTSAALFLPATLSPRELTKGAMHAGRHCHGLGNLFQIAGQLKEHRQGHKHSSCNSTPGLSQLRSGLHVINSRFLLLPHQTAA